ncbi:TetR family transcriptional regulator [Stutzerimonas urumqiensis]|uniref:TetR family transcriptional regulator n=1 Tax=Stutzerimonas urumqiensis TaxID=638269 RepID=UPI000EB2AEC0|nr:TetR family transcriptional regulator [Stutzerimonas urumqiensis]
MRRTKEEAEKTRLALLASAERLFLERGVAHTSLDQIARDAGVTRGAVYWHFQNKSHLFHDLLDQVRLPPEQLAERLRAGDQAQPLEALRNMCVDALQGLASDTQKRRIFTILLHRCEFTDDIRDAAERHDAFVRMVIELFERQFQAVAPRLRDGITPRLAALALHGLVLGLFSDWTRDPSLFASEQETSALFEALLRGLVTDWPA